MAKKIVRIQREFLWGGMEGGKKINWVSWKVVCQPKEVGHFLVERYGPKVCELMEMGEDL